MRNVIPKTASLVPKDAKLVFKGIIYDTYHWQQKMFDGSYKTFEMLKRPDTVKALAVKDNKLVILKQDQPSSDSFYDIPGGRSDIENENELEAVKREMLEETGMTFKTWKLLDVTQYHHKIESFVYIFLATDFVKQIKQNTDSGERIEVILMTFEEVKKLVSSPQARYLPKDILDKVGSINDLVNLPEYKE